MMEKRASEIHLSLGRCRTLILLCTLLISTSSSMLIPVSCPSPGEFNSAAQRYPNGGCWILRIRKKAGHSNTSVLGKMWQVRDNDGKWKSRPGKHVVSTEAILQCFARPVEP